MDVVKVVNLLAGVIITSLIIYLIISDSPEKSLYKDTLKDIMIYENLSTVEETLDAVPELKEINNELKQIANLNTTIRSLTSGPSPNLSLNEKRKLQEYSSEMKTLKKSVNQKLIKLKKTYNDRELSYNLHNK